MSPKNLATGRRRRAGVAALLIAGTLATVAPLVTNVSGASASPPQLDRNLFDYTLFGQKSVWFKGFNQNGGVITNGNVGVNLPGGKLSLCAGAHKATMDPDTQAVGWQIRSGCALPTTDAFFSANYPQLIQGSFRSLNPIDSVTWGANGFINPAPGDPAYQYFHPSWPATCTPSPSIADGTTLSTDGQVFCDFNVAKHATVTVAPNVHTIWVLGLFNVQNGAHVNGNGDVQFFVKGRNLPSTATIAKFGRQATFVGNIDAPTGNLNLGNTTVLTGRFWAYSISSDFSAIVNPPPTTTTSTSTTSTSTSTSTTTTTEETTFTF